MCSLGCGGLQTLQIKEGWCMHQIHCCLGRVGLWPFPMKGGGMCIKPAAGKPCVLKFLHNLTAVG
eukprot:CAMPEP_0115576970 /NCGR_PEP_ID=MMETSP0272-20121206/2832_1 /TAXON_ID=71861 /ORGANISM="Scrippsiella trochoidea, Strain CCMP3099" /LENGTH=64 /DNA_ID=CAMNT_0003011769 /DNA_START=12 /DNA_END=206 /DNA_ORIENTATION=-